MLIACLIGVLSMLSMQVVAYIRGFSIKAAALRIFLTMPERVPKNEQ